MPAGRRGRPIAATPAENRAMWRRCRRVPPDCARSRHDDRRDARGRCWRKHVERGQCVADGAEIAADHQQQRDAARPPSSRAPCAASSSGTMMPPTPSMNSMPEAASTARRLKPISSSKSMPRLSRAAARSGESGARKRQGAMRSISCGAHRAAQRLEQHRRVAGFHDRGVVSAHHRLERVDRWRLRRANAGSGPAVTKVLPISVPVEVTK